MSSQIISGIRSRLNKRLLDKQMMRSLFVCLVMLVWVRAGLAQPLLDEIHVQAGEFSVEYPAGWQVAVDPASSFVYLTHDQLQMTFYSPAVLATHGLENYNPEMLARLLLALNGVQVDGTGQASSSDLFAIPYHHAGAADEALLIAREFKDGTVGLVDVFGSPQAMRAQEQVIYQIAATFDRPPVPAPDMLVNHANAGPALLAELESSELIAAGAQLVFAENYVYTTGTNRLQVLAPSLSMTDVMMAGSLRYSASPAPENESCSMVARLTEGGSRLEVGIDSAGNLYLAEDDARRVLQTGLDVSRAHHLVLLALDDRLLIYRDGALAGDETITPASGSVGIQVRGSASGATCEVTAMRVYEVPAADAGQCEIRASGGAVNKRSGPDASLDIVGVLEAGAAMQARAQAAGADGLIWWQLDDGAWVREDVVTEQGSCRALPADG